MKFELKTENENYSNSLFHFLSAFFVIAFFIIFCDVSLKIGSISRHYQIDHKCKLLSVEKSASNFRKLSKLSKLKSKQRIWEFCKEVIK